MSDKHAIDRSQSKMILDSAIKSVQAEPNGHPVRRQLAANASFKAQMIAQRNARRATEDTSAVLQSAAQGVRGSGGALPHLETIQKSFGHHDVTAVQAFVGGQAKTASEAIGAEAYASGNAIAFRETPTLHTAAHEAAHIVQQRAGVQLSGGVGQVGDKYEMHADAVADLVVQGKSATDLLDQFAGQSPAVQKQTVQRRRWSPAARRGVQPQGLGRVAFESTEGPQSVAVRARTARRWKQFLSNAAGTEYGAMELAAFMAKALGRTFLVGSLAQVRAPSEFQAQALMEALLTVGGKIDLADWSYQQPDEPYREALVAQTGPLLAEFNGRFAAPTMIQMTKRDEKQFENTDAIKAYAEDASDMKDYNEDVEGKPCADPNQQLIASAFGMAVGGASQVGQAGWDADSDTYRNAISQEGFLLIYNGAHTINACLSQATEDKATTVKVLLGVFESAAGAAGAAASGGLAILLGALTPVAKEFFVACLAGEADKSKLTLMNKFDAKINSLVSSGSLGSSHASIIKTEFFKGLSK